MAKMDHNFSRSLGLISIIALLFLSGCAGASVLNLIRSETIGILNPIGLIIGFGIMWYCWVEAKQKNRNPWTWLFLGLIFGFIALLILVYQKKLPAKEMVATKDDCEMS